MHVYIKLHSPQLNGKVERSHRTDQEEFYQLLTYKDDVDLNRKLQEWERFHNYDRPPWRLPRENTLRSRKIFVTVVSDLSHRE
jgi:transposase InsO family protein